MSKQNMRVAIITGGGSGIGLAIAEKFIESGIHTIIVGRDEAKLNNAKTALGTLCYPMRCDVSDLSSIPSLISNVIRQFGKIDILVNNAGINMKKDFTEVTDEEFQRVITTNLCSVFAISREVVKCMLPNKSGCIINISSMAAQYGLPKVIAYSASKTAIDGMTRAMAVELSPLGIRVNAIAPGFIFTKMSSTALDGDPQRKQKVLSRTPMGKLGMPEDVANAAYFLASDESSF